MSRHIGAPRTRVSVVRVAGLVVLALAVIQAPAIAGSPDPQASPASHEGGAPQLAALWPRELTPPFATLDGTEARQRPTTVLLESAAFDTAAAAGADPLARLLPAGLSGAAPIEGGWMLVVFDPAMPDADRRAALQRLGAIPGPAVPQHARLAHLPPGVAPALAAEEGVLWLGRLHPALKLSPRVASLTAVPLTLRAALGGAQAHQDVAATLAAAHPGIDVLESWPGGLLVRAASVEAALAVLRQDDVIHVEPYEAPRLLNDSSRGIVQSGVIGNDSIHQRGVRGNGQILAVMDSGLDTRHCCFDGSGKIADNRAWGGGQLGALCSGDHGTHVAGTALCSNAGDRDGLAPDARVVMQDIQGSGTFACLFGSVSPPADLSTAWSDARSRGAFVHTNSWGGGGNSYGSAANAIDDFMWKNPDFLILYAAGNSGSSPGTLGSYSNAKNSITVGGTVNGANFENMYSSSSRGPAGDGRTLPDLLAPAQGVSSARNASSVSCGWTSYSGTSMATPAAAGAAVLVRDYFTRGFYPSGSASSGAGFTPSAALLKATMLVSTRNMLGTGTGGARPNPNQGFGRVALDDALWFASESEEQRFVVLDDRNMQTGFTAAGQEATFEIPLTGARPVKIMLVWTDAPAAPGSARALVNDLDLEVETADGRRFAGNRGFIDGFTVTPSEDFDRLNNKEGVFLASPMPGPVRVTVRAAAIGDVALRPQDYALVAVAPTDLECAAAQATGVGNTLDVEKSGNDVRLDFAERNASSYTVYRGTAPDFLRTQPNPYRTGISDGDASVGGVQWNDAGAAGNATSYFYVAFSANSCGELVP